MTDFATLGIRVDSNGVMRATKNLHLLEKQGAGAERATAKLTKAFKVGAVAAAAFAGFAATKSVQDISNFTQAIANLSAITGATGKDLAFYADSAKEIGKTTSLSASQAAEAFKLIASAKPDLLANAAALDEVTRSAVTLAEAAGIELPEAASALGSALNQFGLDASKADEVINVLAASSKLGAAEIPAVTEALRNVGSAANALDLDLAETVAGIQALAIAGKQGSDAGTSLRQVLLKLEKTADKNLQPSIVGLSGALSNLKKENLSNAELMKLFGEEAFAAATALLEQSGSVVELNKNLRDTNTATEQAAIRMNTLEGDTKSLNSATEGLSIGFGKKLEPSMRSATQGLTEFTNNLTDNLDTIIKVGGAAAVVIGGRLAGAAFIATASMRAAGIQALRYEYTIARLVGVSRTAATAQLAMAASTRVASGAMALMGGPAGVVLVAAAALYYYATSADTATDSTQLLSKSISDLSSAQAAKLYRDLGNEYEDASGKALDLNSEIKRLQGVVDTPSAFSFITDYQVKDAKDKLITLKSELDDLNSLRERLSSRMHQIITPEDTTEVDRQKAASLALDKLIKAEDRANKARNNAANANTDDNNSDDKIIDGLIRRRELLGLNAEAADLYNAKKDLSNKADSVTLAIASEEITLYHQRLAAIESENKAATDKLELQSRLVANSSAFAQSIKTPTQLFNDQITTLKMWRDTVNETTGEALISQSEYADGVRLAQLELHGLNEEAKKSTSLFGDMQEASESWSKSFADSLVEGGGNFEDFASGMLKELQKIALAKAFAPIFGGFGDLISGAVGGMFGGSSVLSGGSHPSFAGGGFTGNGSRSGGVDGMGGFPAVLHPNETVIDHTRGQKSGGGSTSIVVNVDASGSSASSDENEGKRLGDMIGVAVRAVLIDESRPGGMLA
tara:strand:+ start:174 stop:2918 length:2745 start_codon:yes stop_codon:yes gene_type:complete